MQQKASSRRILSYTNYLCGFIVCGGDSLNSCINLSSQSTECERYLMDQIVIILSKSRWFNLAKVRYKNDTMEFWVDSKLLLHEPDYTHTISLHLLGGTIS